MIGDADYGDLAHNRFFRNTLGVGRLLLVAIQICFQHPYANTELRIATRLDESFRRVFQELGWKMLVGSQGVGDGESSMTP